MSGPNDVSDDDVYLPYYLQMHPTVSGGCVSMATGHATGLWEVSDCTSSREKFLCRQNQEASMSPEPPVPALPPSPAPTPSLTGACPSGWKSNNNLRHCYKVTLRAVISLTQGERLGSGDVAQTPGEI